MKKVLLFLLLLYSVKIFATHNRAGEILYKRIAPYTATVNNVVYPVYNYYFQINTYTEINSPGGNADRCKLILHLGNGDSITLPRVNGPAAGSGGDCGGTFNGEEINFTTKYNKYVGTYAYTTPGIYRVYMYDPNRNAGVINIIGGNSVNQLFYLESMLVISNFVGANSAPDFTSRPLDNACLGICFYHNPGAFDADGDSLSYELTFCRGIDQNGNVGAPIPGYVYPNTGPGGSYSIHPTNGILTWCTPQLNGEYNLAFIVREWRKNTDGKYFEVGYVLRDMQVKTLSCPGNDPPVLIVPQDTCVEAGTLVNKTIQVSDPNVGNFIQLYGFGGPFTSTNPLATLSPTFGATSYNASFSWQTNCNLIRQQPYQITIKAEDQQLPVKQVVFKTFNIKIVPPAVQNVTANPVGTSIIVTWQLSNCFGPANPITGYMIYRKTDCNPSAFDPCKAGPPAGYTLIGNVNQNTTTFTDNNQGMGLVVGQNYSYVIIAVYQDGSLSYGSTAVCSRLKRDIPILLNVDVLSTNENTGSVFVRWTKPLTNVGNLDTMQLTGPYTFNLRYKPLSATTFSTVYSITKNQYYQLNELADTTFTHLGINTLNQQLEYKVEFVANTTTVGNSQRATSVFLTATGGERKVLLSWSALTPWNNETYIVYRKDPTQSTFTLLTTVQSTVYTDSIGVANGSTYCYFIEAEGKYTDTSVPGPLFNKSQEACAMAEDLTPPCAPTLTINSDCITGFVEVRWNDLSESCANDVVKYCLYKKATEDEEFVLIDTLYGTANTVFTFDNLDEIAACFAVAAIDSAGNVGPKSEDFCVDNCPEFELPNIITLNGDGVNDFFKARKVRHIKEIDMYVYDRWGTLVFKTKDPYFKWDGTSIASGKIVSDGTLFYVCDVYEARVKKTKKYTLTGYVQVAK